MRNNKHCGKEFSRRGFLRGICAASMAAGVPGRMWGAAARVGMPDLRIGVLSDIHLSYDKNGFRENPQSEMQGVFIKALEYFRDRHVDGVLVCGDVKGYKFILSHFVNTAPGATVDLDKYMAKYGSDSSKPVFYSQHRWMKGTYCTDDDMWGADSGGQKPILDRYPNCVAFTGHTHYMLTDDRTVWQGGFTCINAGALLNQAVGRFRENGVLISWVSKDIKMDRQMRMVDNGQCHAGMVFNLYGTDVVLERRDMVRGEPLGPCHD